MALNKPPKKPTNREAWELFEKQHKRPHPDNKPKEMPGEALHMWEHFLELNATRQSNGFSPLPISYQEILAYCKLTNQNFTKFEMDCLRRFDADFLEWSSMVSNSKATDKNPTTPPRR